MITFIHQANGRDTQQHKNNLNKNKINCKSMKTCLFTPPCDMYNSALPSIGKAYHCRNFKIHHL